MVYGKMTLKSTCFEKRNDAALFLNDDDHEQVITE